MIKIRTRETNQLSDSQFSTELEGFTFSGGEEHINFLKYGSIASCTITAIIDSSSELIRLCLLKDIIDQHRCKTRLVLSYVPYARQDRRCSKGDPFSLGVFCRILNSLKFDLVQIADPHSDVTEALIDNIEVTRQIDIISKSPELTQLAGNTIAVSPDAGANKKVQVISAFSGKEFIRADKIRDAGTGEITSTVVYSEDLTNLSVTIWDDICDGGRTFIELAKKLKEKNAKEINLYVTHGIFSRGIECLLDCGIDHIYTTDSINGIKESESLTVIKL